MYEKKHFAEKRKTYHEYYIHNLKNKVLQHIASCVPCIVTNKEKGYLQPVQNQLYY